MVVTVRSSSRPWWSSPSRSKRIVQTTSSPRRPSLIAHETRASRPAGPRSPFQDLHHFLRGLQARPPGRLEQQGAGGSRPVRTKPWGNPMATHGEIRWPPVGTFDGRLWGDSHGRRHAGSISAIAVVPHGFGNGHALSAQGQRPALGLWVRSTAPACRQRPEQDDDRTLPALPRRTPQRERDRRRRARRVVDGGAQASRRGGRAR